MFRKGSNRSEDVYWSWRRALLVIGIVTLLCSGGSIAGYFWWRHEREARRSDPHFIISKVMCHCYRGDELPEDYLKSLLGLSGEQQQNLYAFSVQQGIEDLSRSPWIARAELIKVPPGMLVLQYATREPVAALADFEGSLIDEEGVIFPKDPFFSHRRFVTLHLGWKRKLSWGKPVSTLKLHEAYRLLSMLDQRRLPVVEVDMTHASEASYGKREILITLREPEKVVLRLSPRYIVEALDDYLLLRKQKSFRSEGDIEVDLRIPDLAYIKK